MLRRFVSRAALIAVLTPLLAPGIASADIQLSATDSSSLSSDPAPYVNVSVSVSTFGNTETATITFESESSGKYEYLLTNTSTSNPMVGANVANVGSVSSVSVSGTLFQPSPSSGGSGSMGGFGTFNETVDPGSGFLGMGAYTEVVLKLTARKNTWTNASDVLLSNSLGNSLAAYVAVWNTQANFGFGGFTGDAGYVSQNTIQTASVPEPSTMALASLGAIGFLAHGLRRRGRR